MNKQSAFYFQAAVSNTTLDANVVFNGARSGVNFNDAFGAGSVVSRNTLFNLNRETADHGCFNSWDRLPFSISKDAQHKDLLERNMLLSNFNSYNGIDTVRTRAGPCAARRPIVRFSCPFCVTWPSIRSML